VVGAALAVSEVEVELMAWWLALLAGQFQCHAVFKASIDECSSRVASNSNRCAVTAQECVLTCLRTVAYAHGVVFAV
jgi:hypothetical protein